MTLSNQEISDRLEIQELLVRYCYAADDQDYDEFLRMFTDDAMVDYTQMGGPRGTPASTIPHLKKAMSRILSSQHTITNSLIEIDGDIARGRTICHCPMVIDMGSGQTKVFFQGIWYVDVLRRTPKGWRIAERKEVKSYMYNVPDNFWTEGIHQIGR